MAAAGARRPIPALIFLLLLALLTAIVWWRVLHRAEQTSTGRTSSSCAQPSDGR
jgi:membrane protein implicated in regulation of membrane protease activity